ncbi:MAG TPA: HK97 gp10 family phage protein [Terriglobales bacterium]
MNVRIVGAREAADELTKLAKKSPRAMERAFYKYGNEEMKEAKRLTPKDEGTLRDSGIVDEPRWEGSNLVMELGFGGAAEEYAAIVHEDLEAFHAEGQAKFLETPLNESEPYLDQRVGADFEHFMGLDK